MDSANIFKIKKKKEESQVYDPNSLIIKKNTNINVKKTPDKNYKSTTAYKPTGNLIYNTSLLKTIQEEIKK